MMANSSNNSRTKNTIINATTGGISKIIIFVVQFVCRTIFIKYLSTEYLGINGLFTNILTMLSFAELGIGNAIIFKLYKPIADDDKEKIKSYIEFYKKAYIYIGIVVLTIGVCIIPFLKYIIKGAPNIKESIELIYVIFLLNSSISYFFAYKKSIVTGYQKEYILTGINFFVTVLQNILQIVLLILTRNFILYLVVQLLCTILDNVISSRIADKMYPYIKEKDVTKISKEEEKNIFKDVKSLILYKIGYILSNGTDNIIISSFVGVSQVGLLSNYTTITNALTAFLTSFFSGFTASVGNLNTSSDNKKKENIYYQIILLSFLIYTFISVEVILLANNFIEIWLGKEYLLTFSVCIALGLNIYIDGMRFSNYTFRNTMGLFKKGRLVPLISSISNVILSVILVKRFEIFGVLIATAITRCIILTMVDPYLLHKYRFKSSSRRFYITYAYYGILFLIILLISYYIQDLIKLDYIFGFVIKGIVIAFVSITMSILGSLRLSEFKGLYDRSINIISNKFKRGRD